VARTFWFLGVHLSVEPIMKARDIMTPNPAVVTPDDPIARAAQIMRDSGVGMVPVVDDKSSLRLKGVLTDRDIVIRCVAERHAPNCLVSDHMTADDVETVTLDDDIHDVVAKMETDQVRRIPVIDESRRLTGVIAQADVARKVGPREPHVVQDLVEKVSEPPADVV
jgi:CBS domain-containing protein